MLSIEERYKLLQQTIEECGKDILSEDDEMIAYKLFEEFATDAVSFLHENLLDALLDEGMIDDEIYEKCRELRKKYVSIESNSALMNIDAVKTSSEWQSLMNLSDEIRQSFYW